MAIRVETVFCDDIRQEIDGRQTLVGVYGPGLDVDKFPRTVRISLWVRVLGMPVGKHKIGLTVQPPGDSKAIVTDGEVDVEAEDDSLVLAFVRMPLKLMASGRVVGTLKIASGEFPIDSLRVGVRSIEGDDRSVELPLETDT